MDALPSEQQRRELAELVMLALVEIRALARAAGQRQIEDLADAFHNLPAEMHGWGTWNPRITRGMLADYCARYGIQGYLERFDRILQDPDAAK